MIIVENKEEMVAMMEEALEKVMLTGKASGPVLGGWDSIESFLGVKKHQVKLNHKAGMYGDALQISGHSAILNTERLWQVLKERKER